MKKKNNFFIIQTINYIIPIRILNQFFNKFMKEIKFKFSGTNICTYYMEYLCWMCYLTAFQLCEHELVLYKVTNSNTTEGNYFNFGIECTFLESAPPFKNTMEKSAESDRED